MQGGDFVEQPIFTLFLGAAMLVMVVVATAREKMPARGGGWIYMDKQPLTFWFSIAIMALVGMSFIADYWYS